ncbi:group III truncated hemoglobin [Lentilitoribacter sp. Alg239-R112]|jgi:hemoglobin|uniref:group III truncated hemoglobin n=1 Tax=Lentilitoribacter sp. Alg239-R112 TaxID=2305987 RepID=UPI0013A70BA8|nr:group III truncated hemoglobin [Lentilitoribacter sp. Alg239-R112]
MTHHIHPRSARIALHPTITEEQISEMVETFYARVQKDDALAPIFANNIQNTWPVHLERMKVFWRSVLLKSGEYKGQPVPIHQKIDGLTEENFEQWLILFADTAYSIFHSDAAPLVFGAAKNIATSLWLSRNQDPFAQPPKWQLKPNDRIEK